VKSKKEVQMIASRVESNQL